MSDTQKESSDGKRRRGSKLNPTLSPGLRKPTVSRQEERVFDLKKDPLCASSKGRALEKN